MSVNECAGAVLEKQVVDYVERCVSASVMIDLAHASKARRTVIWCRNSDREPTATNAYALRCPLALGSGSRKTCATFTVLGSFGPCVARSVVKASRNRGLEGARVVAKVESRHLLRSTGGVVVAAGTLYEQLAQLVPVSFGGGDVAVGDWTEVVKRSGRHSAKTSRPYSNILYTVTPSRFSPCGKGVNHILLFATWEQPKYWSKNVLTCQPNPESYAQMKMQKISFSHASLQDPFHSHRVSNPLVAILQCKPIHEDLRISKASNLLLMIAKVASLGAKLLFEASWSCSWTALAKTTRMMSASFGRIWAASLEFGSSRLCSVDGSTDDLLMGVKLEGHDVFRLIDGRLGSMVLDLGLGRRLGSALLVVIEEIVREDLANRALDARSACSRRSVSTAEKPCVLAIFLPLFARRTSDDDDREDGKQRRIESRNMMRFISRVLSVKFCDRKELLNSASLLRNLAITLHTVFPGGALYKSIEIAICNACITSISNLPTSPPSSPQS
ncbi:hypothetical protein KCV07_g85, partial [Aureobasidium melanogenum]